MLVRPHEHAVTGCTGRSHVLNQSGDTWKMGEVDFTGACTEPAGCIWLWLRLMWQPVHLFYGRTSMISAHVRRKKGPS